MRSTTIACGAAVLALGAWSVHAQPTASTAGNIVVETVAKGLDHLDPLAWRTLCERLYEFRDTHRDELVHFNFPLIYFTERELRGRVIGDDELADAYLTHVAAVEEGVTSTKPFHACPAMDVPQVYVYANDGPSGPGAWTVQVWPPSRASVS